MKNNVASRILKILDAWGAVPDHDSAAKGWAIVFKQDVEGIRASLQTVRRLGLLHEELEHLRVQLEKHGSITISSYESTLDNIEQALSPMIIRNQAQHVKQYLRPEVYAVLKIIVDVLPAEEEEISVEDFASIVDLINQLELTLQDSAVPSSLVIRIRHHIMLAESAIAEYPLRGAKGMRDVAAFVVGDLYLNEPDLIPSETRIAIGLLWDKVIKVTSVALKVEGGIKLMTRVTDLLVKSL